MTSYTKMLGIMACETVIPSVSRQKLWPRTILVYHQKPKLLSIAIIVELLPEQVATPISGEGNASFYIKMKQK